MREPLNWNYTREHKPLTPEKLMRILDKTEGGNELEKYIDDSPVKNLQKR